MSDDDKELNVLFKSLDTLEQNLSILINDLLLTSDLKTSNLKISIQLSLYMDHLDKALILAHEHPLLSKTHFYLDHITEKQSHLSILKKKTRENSVIARQSIQLKERQSLIPGNNIESRSATQASIQLTDTMQTALDMMRVEIEKSAAALVELDSQSQMIGDTGKEFHAYDDSMNTSMGLLKRMSRREMMDRYMIWVGIAIFVMTILYIVSRRMWVPNLMEPVYWVIGLLDY